MKYASRIWYNKLHADKELLDIIWFLVNLVHDEYITEGSDNVKLMLKIAQVQSDSIREAGEVLGCRCPLAGSYYNDNAKDFTIGKTWLETH